MKVQLSPLLPYFFLYTFLLVCSTVYAFFSKSPALLAIFATLSAICVFSIVNVVGWYCTHRHDRDKNSAKTSIYDAIYGVVLKYLILIFLLCFYFKYINLLNELFIVVFVTIILIKNILTIKIFKNMNI